MFGARHRLSVDESMQSRRKCCCMDLLNHSFTVGHNIGSSVLANDAADIIC